MKLFYLKSIILFCLATLCFSCKKSENLKENDIETISQDISVKNGMLVFRNSDVLKTTIRQVSGLSAEEYAQWVKTYPGFQSYKLTYHQAVDAFESIATIDGLSNFKEKYKDIVTITKDTSLTEIFASPVISNFVNKEGQFRVGDSLNILTNDKWVLISPDNKNALATAKSSRETDSIRGIFVSSYRDSESNLENTNHVSTLAANNVLPEVPGSMKYNFLVGSPWMNSGGMFFDQTYYNGDNDRRLIVRLVHDKYPNDANNNSTSIYSLYVNQESKKIFGWGANKTGYQVRIHGPAVAYFGYTVLGVVDLDWTKHDTKGPFTFQLMNVFGGNPKQFNGTMKIWTQGVPNNPTNI